MKRREFMTLLGRLGLVASLARPSGSLTGIMALSARLPTIYGERG